MGLRELSSHRERLRCSLSKHSLMRGLPANKGVPLTRRAPAEWACPVRRLRFWVSPRTWTRRVEPPVPLPAAHPGGAFAELEREMIRERVRAGLRTAKAQGKALGTPQAGLQARRGGTPALPGPELAEDRASAGSADVHGDRRLPFEKPPAPLRLQAAEKRQVPLLHRAFEKHMICGHHRWAS